MSSPLRVRVCRRAQEAQASAARGARSCRTLRVPARAMMRRCRARARAPVRRRRQAWPRAPPARDRFAGSLRVLALVVVVDRMQVDPAEGLEVALLAGIRLVARQHRRIAVAKRLGKCAEARLPPAFERREIDEAFATRFGGRRKAF